MVMSFDGLILPPESNENQDDQNNDAAGQPQEDKSFLRLGFFHFQLMLFFIKGEGRPVPLR